LAVGSWQLAVGSWQLAVILKIFAMHYKAIFTEHYKVMAANPI
jgi:hypothetical protein